jgi:hypothetical protein
MSGYRRALGAVTCLLALGGGAGAAAPAASVAAARPAIWRTYDMIVNFQSLPRTYTCDQLWYEFRGILLRLGAPAATISILPYDCSPSPTGDMTSPRVEIRFQLPFVLLPGVRGAPIEAVERTVRLSPGEPKTLRAADCQLLQQIDQTMLASMPVKVQAAHFACSGSGPRAGRFAVTLSVPAPAGARAVAAASSPASPGAAPH